MLEALYSHPILNVNYIEKITGVSFSAANQLMQKFVGSDLLSETTGQVRNRRFRYDDYIALFADERRPKA